MHIVMSSTVKSFDSLAGASGSDSLPQSVDDETEVRSVTSICSEPHSDRSSVGQGKL